MAYRLPGHTPAPSSLPSASSSARCGVPQPLLLSRHPAPRQRWQHPVRATATQQSSDDPFVSGALRLQSLVKGCGGGQDELGDMMLAQEDPVTKLQTSAAFGSLLCAAAASICTLCGSDLLGGVSQPSTSVSWAAAGAAASLPLVGLRLWSWTQAASSAAPALSDMHEQQLRIQRPWLTRMSGPQTALLMAAEVLPPLLLLLPAAQALFGVVSGAALQAIAPPDAYDAASPEQALAVRAAGLALAAAAAALGRTAELGMSEEELEVVETAAGNADRFYRLTATDAHSRGPGAERAASAFKFVSQAYIENRSDAALLAGVVAFSDVMFFGMLWAWSGGNLAAPAAAALMVNWVDYAAMHYRTIEQKGSGRSQA